MRRARLRARWLLLGLRVHRRRAGDARPAGPPPARGRPRLPGAGQAEAGARQLQHRGLELPEHRLGRAGAARDRPLPHGGRGRRRQGAGRVRAGDQAARAQRRGARRLLLPGPADAQPRHHARPRSRTRSPSSRASRRSTRRAPGCRARLRPRPSRTGARAATRRRPTSTAASRSSTRPPTRRPPPSTRSAGRSRSRASRGSAMEEFQQVRNRFPAERLGRAGAPADDRALPAVRRRRSPRSRSTRPSRPAPATW